MLSLAFGEIETSGGDDTDARVSWALPRRSGFKGFRLTNELASMAAGF